MSGGERNQRKRTQQQRSKGKGQAAKAVASARGTNTSRNTTIAAVVVVIVLAAAVVGGVLYINGQKEAKGTQADQIRTELNIPNGGVPVAQVSADQRAPRVADGVIEEGNPKAPMTVDLYEDFLCPVCGALYQQSHSEIEQAVDQGKIKVNYHMMGFLDNNSKPPGYSSRAANAALCSVEGGKFREYYDKLYASQPQEGGPGYSDDQLAQLGKTVGLGGDFASCVTSGKHAQQVAQVTKQGESRLSDLSSDGSIGTPTAVIANRVVRALGVPEWLSSLIGAKKS